ncbi:MAG: regulatory protein RecX [Bacteroidia bacterium]
MTSDNKIINKVRKYCTYQERSQQELRDKLYNWGLHKADVEKTIAQMVEEGFMSEERFAMAFAGGKFRIKNWGRIKIKLALKQKKVSDYCIRKALNEIDNKDYRKTLEKLISSYSKKISEKNTLKKNYKIAQHAIGKGFEPDIVWDFLRDDEGS